MKRTDKSRLDELEGREWKLNASERLEELERFKRDFLNGRYVIVPQKRFEQMEKAMGMEYRINRFGKYEKRK
jgi:hypothetical protein